ncbi:MAG: hypothetical protein HYY50_01290 [Candidatus Kerfeldbacteria bacterium]|nr:hypothetical protein [Candidatus Kerfeldbacteria bacterium]
MPRYLLTTAVLSLGLLLTAIITQAQGTNGNFNRPGLSNDWQTAIDELRNARQNFRTTRQEAARNLANRAVNARQELLARRFEHRQAAMLRLLDVYTRHLERTKDRVNRMPIISDEEKANAVSKIDEALVAVAGLHSQVEDASDDETLKSLIPTIREQVRNYHTIVRGIVRSIHASRISAFLDQANDRTTDLGARLDALKAAGHDVSALETKLTEAEDKLAQAETQRANGEYRLAIQSLKDVYQLLRQVLPGINEIGAGGATE